MNFKIFLVCGLICATFVHVGAMDTEWDRKVRDVSQALNDLMAEDACSVVSSSSEDSEDPDEAFNRDEAERNKFFSSQLAGIGLPHPDWNDASALPSKLIASRIQSAEAILSGLILDQRDAICTGDTESIKNIENMRTMQTNILRQLKSRQDAEQAVGGAAASEALPMEDAGFAALSSRPVRAAVPKEFKDLSRRERALRKLEELYTRVLEITKVLETPEVIETSISELEDELRSHTQAFTDQFKLDYDHAAGCPLKTLRLPKGHKGELTRGDAVIECSHDCTVGVRFGGGAASSESSSAPSGDHLA